MYNLYSMTKNQAVIRTLFRANRDSTGNLPVMPGIFPDYPAPVVRNSAAGRELAMARWGMPLCGAFFRGLWVLDQRAIADEDSPGIDEIAEAPALLDSPRVAIRTIKVRSAV